MTEQRRLVAIVLADVVGYLRLLGTNRTTALAARRSQDASYVPGPFRWPVAVVVPMETAL